MSIPAIHLTNWWRKLLLHVQILHTKDIWSNLGNPETVQGRRVCTNCRYIRNWA
jgi:hypothetical protein